MLTENKVYKIAKECGVTVEPQSNGLSVKYRGVELCKYSCEPELKGQTCLLLQVSLDFLHLHYNFL